ncbi:MAG: SMP-30/gluconolactonase/LRE family protein [Bacteroidia bacterium]|nr:SMP-30/gluconolactonase/LRE family protein [Bacteroidia bacterium]
MKNYLLLLAAICLFSCEASKEESTKTNEVFDVKEEAFYNYLQKDDTLEILSEGFNWSEGPVWVGGEDGYVLFSDVPENKVFKWSVVGGLETYLDPSGYTGEGKREGANGLALDLDGRLLLCQHGDRRVARLGASMDKPSAAYETVADRYELKRFNSPNDLCIDKAGNIYFTDPPYGLPGQEQDSSREIPYMGVYRIDTSGQVHLLVDSLTRPNGIALSPDESTLYVANSDANKAYWVSYTLNEDKSLGRGRVFADATSLVGDENPGLPDGLKVLPDGSIFATGPGGVWVFSAEGQHLGTIRTGQATANCAFGYDNKYLYMTADMYLMRVALKQVNP